MAAIILRAGRPTVRKSSERVNIGQRSYGGFRLGRDESGPLTTSNVAIDDFIQPLARLCRIDTNASESVFAVFMGRFIASSRPSRTPAVASMTNVPRYSTRRRLLRRRSRYKYRRLSAGCGRAGFRTQPRDLAFMLGELGESLFDQSQDRVLRVRIGSTPLSWGWIRLTKSLLADFPN